MRLGGYTRVQNPGSEARGQKLAILGVVVVAHVAALIWWNTLPADAEARSREMREYVRYYDITPAAPSGTLAEPAPGATLDSVGTPPVQSGSLRR